MFNRFKTYVEQEPWEEKVPVWFKRCDAVGWAVLVVAVLYFGPFCLSILFR